MVQIKFTATGANSALGSFSSGDRANVSEAFARHLVEEARVATDLPPPALSAAAEPQKITRRKKSAKE